jgi:hypothetical protein
LKWYRLINLTILVGRVNVPLTSLFKTERLIKILVRIMTVTKLLPEGRTPNGRHGIQHNDLMCYIQHIWRSAYFTVLSTSMLSVAIILMLFWVSFFPVSLCWMSSCPRNDVSNNIWVVHLCVRFHRARKRTCKWTLKLFMITIDI